MADSGSAGGGGTLTIFLQKQLIFLSFNAAHFINSWFGADYLNYITCRLLDSVLRSSSKAVVYRCTYLFMC